MTAASGTHYAKSQSTLVSQLRCVKSYNRVLKKQDY